ncbi:MAG: FxsA family protein [Campylobacterales bacterium]|nr:FxsA family protein [Campylobacterales bacterium]
MVYFFIYLFVEVMLSSSIAAYIGGLNVFLEILISAFIGLFILQNFKFALVENIKEVATGTMSQEEFVKTNVAKAIGAVLLIIPGFFTDFLGLFLQFGIFTMLISKMFHLKQQPKSTYESFSNRSYTNNSNYTRRSNDEIIDVEIVDDSKSIKH